MRSRLNRGVTAMSHDDRNSHDDVWIIRKVAIASENAKIITVCERKRGLHSTGINLKLSYRNFLSYAHNGEVHSLVVNKGNKL